MSRRSHIEVDLYCLLKDFGLHLKESPHDFLKIRELSDRLTDRVYSIRNPNEFALAYFLYLAITDTIANLIEEDSISPPALQQLGKQIGNILFELSEKYHRIKEDSFIRVMSEFTSQYREILDKYAFVKASTYTLPIARKRIPVKLSLTGANEFCVGGEFFPYFVNLDELFTTKDTSRHILNLYANKIKRAAKRIRFNKLCFVQKSFGPIGAITLMPYLTSRVGLDAIIYRPNHWKDRSKIVGHASPGDNVAIVYDIAVTGSAISSTARFLRERYDVKTSYALVLLDYGYNARDSMNQLGIVLDSVFPGRRIRQLILGQYEKEWEELGNRVYEGKVEPEKVEVETEALYQKITSLAIFTESKR